MARFTDQFDRHHPKTFKPSLGIATWPALVQADAIALLKGIHPDYWWGLAEACEVAIDEEAAPYNFPVPKESWLATRTLTGWVTKSSLASTDSIRDAYSDLNLLLNAIECNRSPSVKVPVKEFTAWHYLAAFALWKLIDAKDVLFGHSPRNIVGLIGTKPEERALHGASIAMEAQAAVSNAQQLKERARHVENMRLAVIGWERQKRSARASNAGHTRSTNYQAIGDKALQIVTKMNKRFVNETKQSEAVHAALPPSYRARCKPSSVKRWLKERGWKRKK